VPIRTECPQCGRVYNLADAMAGKKVRCKECATTIDVVEDGIVASPRPTPRKAAVRRDDDDRDVRRRRLDRDDDIPDLDRKKNGTPGWLIALIAGGGVAAVLFVALVIWLFTRSSEPEQPLIAVNLAFPQPGQEVPPPQIQINPPFVNPPQPRPQPPRPQPPIRPNPRPEVKQPDAPIANVPPPEVKVVDRAFEWTVKVDIGPKVSADAFKIKPPLQITGGNVAFVLPTTASEFAAVRAGHGDKQVWQSFHLPSLKTSKGLGGRIELQNPAVSPDGKFLAGSVTSGDGRAVQVFSFETAKFLGSIPVGTRFGGAQFVDFTGDGMIITGTHDRGNTLFQVWNPVGGGEVRRFEQPGNFEPRRVGWSPTRKYLAVPKNDFRDHEVIVYEVAAGKIVGHLPSGELGSVSAAFSPDGQEIAIYADNHGRGELKVYNVATGEQSAAMKWEKSPASLTRNSHGYQGRPIEWTPDKSAFLLYGEILIANPSGAVVFQIPRDDRDHSTFPRKFVGPDHLAVMSSVSGRDAMQLVPMLRTEIASLIKKKAAGTAAQAELEKTEIKPGDLKSAKTLPEPTGRVAWKGPLAPLPAAPKARVNGPMALRRAKDDVVEILLTNAVTNQAVLLVRENSDPLSGKDLIKAERYDLANGRLISATPLFTAVANKRQAFTPGSKVAIKLDAFVSPDGNLLAISKPAEPSRVDLWNLKDSKSLGAFAPHENAPLDGLAIVDEQTLWTCGDGKLVLWNVPDLKASVVIPGWRSRLILSPNDKILVAAVDGRVEAIDAQSGQRLGTFAAGQFEPERLLAGYFSPSGKEFVAALSRGKERALAHWDLANGAFLGEIPVAAPAQDPFGGDTGETPSMAFASPAHVFFDRQLYTWSFPSSPLFQFHGATGMSRPTPDGAMRAVSAPFRKDAALVVPGLLPAQAQLLTARLPNAERVTPPGSTFNIQVSGGTPEWQDRAKKALEDEITRLGHQVGDTGFQILASAEIKATGKNIEYLTFDRPGPGLFPPIGPGPFGPRPGSRTVTISEQELKVDLKVMDAKGMEVYKTHSVITSPRSFTSQTDDIAGEITASMWRSVGAPSISPLSKRYRIDNQTFDLPVAANWGN
jgi:predicted Zn finger-like uncharacterized protein